VCSGGAYRRGYLFPLSNKRGCGLYTVWSKIGYCSYCTEQENHVNVVIKHTTAKDILIFQLTRWLDCYFWLSNEYTDLSGLIT
jgi:hypothetical protein